MRVKRDIEMNSKILKDNAGSAGIRFVIFVLIVLVIAGGVALVSLHSMGKAMDPSSEEVVTVEIPEGSGTGAIGSILEENGLVKSAFSFKLKSRIDGNDGEYKAGSYELSPSMTLEEIMDIIIEGKQQTLTLTIPEGFTLNQIAEKVEEAGCCTADDFLQEAQNGDFDFEYNDSMVSGSARYEGFLYPDTYEVFENESAHSIIQRMLERFEEIYDQAAADSDMTSSYNVYQLVTVASLVEREAKLDEERPLVASVVYNRLAKGMNLQMCSTVQYALGTPKARLLYSDLEIDSPYNTYKYSGLPAGPIASPGKASLEAALNPADTDYLYFVLSAEGSSSHKFAASGNDFNSYKEDYLASLAE